MERRDFFKLCSLAGIGVASYAVDSRRSARAAEPYKGPFWVTIHAGGGWDPTLLCDPKGNTPNSINGKPVNAFRPDEIANVGPIRYAPVKGHRAFFEKYASRLLVLNGVDTRTNNHDTGARVTWSGLTAEGRPSLAALIAGAAAPNRPLAFITNGGYDATGGVIAATRLGGGLGSVKALAYPNRIDANRDKEEPEGFFFYPEIYEKIRAARDRRVSMHREQAHLPRIQNALGTLYAARLGTSDLRQLLAEIPPDMETRGNPLFGQAQIAVAAFKSGLAASANLSMGGFDTHGNNDNPDFGQPARLAQILAGIDLLVSFAAEKGIADKLYVVVGSDFGRTPWLNSGNGKDHWPVTSMLLMGPGIRGGRVIGSTDESFRSKGIDATTLADAGEGRGLKLSPGHVHRALRKAAGLETNEIIKRFPIDAELLPLLA